MKKAILKMTEGAAVWPGMVLLIGYLAVGCQTDHKGPFPATGNESGSTTNASDVKVPVTGPVTGVLTKIGDTFAIGDSVRVTFSGITTPIQPHEERIKDDGTSPSGATPLRQS